MMMKTVGGKGLQQRMMPPLTGTKVVFTTWPSVGTGTHLCRGLAINLSSECWGTGSKRGCGLRSFVKTSNAYREIYSCVVKQACCTHSVITCPRHWGKIHSCVLDQVVCTHPFLVHLFWRLHVVRNACWVCMLVKQIINLWS